ncbi:MAG: endonuclease [Saprospiraceae bacterium]
MKFNSYSPDASMIYKLDIKAPKSTYLSWVLLISALLFGRELKAQLFPGLEGEVLADAIRADFTPTQLLTFAQAKDTLYARIFIQNDSVRCIYTGLPHYLPPGVDPSQWVFGTGNETESINLEHGWPQAKGAGDGTNGQMNMYNLFPSRVAVNSDRGDFPYSDIDDNNTTKWYYLGQQMASKPTSNIDAYSEYISGFFEPRESVKGDIARAMFYFWTIYRTDAIAADPGFFELQRVSLCQWQEEDPVDDFENLRNQRIAVYQGGKENPFVLDCTLAQRAYCPLQSDCNSVAVHETPRQNSKIHFDPSQSRLEIESDLDQKWNINVVQITGEHVYKGALMTNEWSGNLNLVPGIYIAYTSTKDQVIFLKFFIAPSR